MGGKSKSSTGVGFIDNAVDSTVGAIQGAGMNIERNTQNTLNNVALLAKGDFNNVGQSLLQNYAAAATLGLANPDDIRRLTGASGVERKKDKTEADAAAQVATDAANVVAEKDRQIKSTIAGVVGAYQRAPGRNQSLLRGGPGTASNTLLTISGNR